MAVHYDGEDRALVFSIGLNGYGWAWWACVRTHKQYAKRQGFSYACVDLPWTISATEAAWLKIPLIVRTLESSPYGWVFFLDADTLVRRQCPDFRSVATPGRDIYMAHGHSGRVNSGVIAVRKSEQSLQFFRNVVADCENTVPREDVAPYENGHMIKHGKASPVVGLLERRWNNTAEMELDDYIRHFTGPMAAQSNVSSKARTRCQLAAKLRNKILSLWTPAIPGGSLPERLDFLTDATLARYRAFDRPNA